MKAIKRNNTISGNEIETGDIIICFDCEKQLIFSAVLKIKKINDEYRDLISLNLLTDSKMSRWNIWHNYSFEVFNFDKICEYKLDWDYYYHSNINMVLKLSSL